jgi:hypothetical protein
MCLQTRNRWVSQPLIEIFFVHLTRFLTRHAVLQGRPAIDDVLKHAVNNSVILVDVLLSRTPFVSYHYQVETLCSLETHVIVIPPVVITVTGTYRYPPLGFRIFCTLLKGR